MTINFVVDSGESDVSEFITMTLTFVVDSGESDIARMFLNDP